MVYFVYFETFVEVEVRIVELADGTDDFAGDSADYFEHYQNFGVAKFAFVLQIIHFPHLECTCRPNLQKLTQIFKEFFRCIF